MARWWRPDRGRRRVALVSRLRGRSAQEAPRFRAAAMWVWCKRTDHQNLRLTAAFAWRLMRRPTKRQIPRSLRAKLDSGISSALSLPVDANWKVPGTFPKICYAKIHASEEIPISEIV